MKINIIGAGLAGSEAAYQLSKKGYKINLYEVKSIKQNPVQVTKNFGELVCSNSLRSNDLSNAVGTLKEEMRLLDSLIIKAAEFAQVPAGGSLAVDRDKFSEFITNKIKNDNNINVINQEIENINFNEINLIASGPLTTEKLQSSLTKFLGNDGFYFFDAVAPIVTKDSIDMSIAFRKNRYDKGETKDYINCPMTKEQYENFYNELIKAEISVGHLEGENPLKYFEGCMPVEAMAKRGIQTLLYGPLKPLGLRNLDGTNNYAVVQLRQDNAKDTLYNLVGFQTNLKWPEQKRVFSMIPGLENANFIRYGVMHMNNFINSPKLLNKGIQLKSNLNIFFAGQITGVEGYVESASSGIIAALNIDRYINKKELIIPNSKSVIGALLNYISNTNSDNFQPMKANWGIVDELINFNKKQGKDTKNELRSQNAIESIKEFINKL